MLLKLLEENIGEYFYNLWLGKAFIRISGPVYRLFQIGWAVEFCWKLQTTLQEDCLVPTPLL